MTTGRRSGGIRGLAASNIAWEPSEDDAVAAILRRAGFMGVEIAPTKRWDRPFEASKKEIAAYRAEWEKRGLKIVALQALLYGRPDLQLFGSPVTRRIMREYVIGMIEMAAGLGAHALVFGSPKNRQRGSMPLDEANDIAREFFRDIGAVAVSRDCVICIEPNPPAYECDYITTMAEAVALCERVASRGVRLQGDIGAMISMSEDPATAVTTAGWMLRHFHVSEPGLAQIADDRANEAAAIALDEIRYGGWVSIEMKAAANEPRVDAVARAAKRVAAIYGGRTSAAFTNVSSSPPAA